MNQALAAADSELIERCLKSDQTAWRALVQRYERLVYSVALTLCSEREDASDVFQQVWTELYQRLSDLRAAEALPAWLITVTRRKTYALIRSRRNSPQLDSDVPEVSARLSSIEDQHAIERSLEQLPERCRKLIDLLYFRTDEPSYSEIARQMGMPVSSIGPTRARCLEKMRKLLG